MHHKHGKRLIRSGFVFFIFGLLMAISTGLQSCTSDSEDGPREIQFNLSDSLKNYSKVVITLIDTADSKHVLATAFSGKLANPKSLTTYAVPDSVGSSFRIRIQAFNDAGQLALQTDIGVTGGVASEPKKVPPEKLPALLPTLASARLANLEVSIGTLVPAF